MKTLRLATLNLYNQEIDRHERLARAARWVRAEGIEVLCVQESTLDAAGTTSELLAEMSGLQHVTPVDQESAAAGALTAVLTSLPHHGGHLLDVPDIRGDRHRHGAAHVSTSAGDLLVCSVHLAWGPFEALRLEQARQIVRICDATLSANGPAIVAGDLNTVPDSDTVSYLRGRSSHEPMTIWVDAWDHPLDEQVDGTTSDGTNEYAVMTAHSIDRDPVLDVSLLPQRRIDYIFSRGWRHGRAFTPTRTRVVSAPLMSDHYAVVTDLLLHR